MDLRVYPVHVISWLLPNSFEVERSQVAQQFLPTTITLLAGSPQPWNYLPISRCVPRSCFRQSRYCLTYVLLHVQISAHIYINFGQNIRVLHVVQLGHSEVVVFGHSAPTSYHRPLPACARCVPRGHSSYLGSARSNEGGTRLKLSDNIESSPG